MDIDWVWKLQNDENKALTEIYRLFRSECIDWLRNNYGVDQDDSIEVFQNSVIVLYDNVVSGKLVQLSSNIKTYLFGIAKNQALNLQKYNKRIATNEIKDGIEYYVLEENEHMIKEKELQQANTAIEILGDPCKSLLQLYYYKGMNMEDISELLGYKNADTTKNQKYKCLKRLQKIYFEYKGSITG